MIIFGNIWRVKFFTLLKMTAQFYGKTNAPNCVLSLLCNTQLAESLRVWYLYRDKMKDNLGYGNYHLQDFVWWNRNIRLKTKKILFFFTRIGLTLSFVLWTTFIEEIILLNHLKTLFLNLTSL